MSQPRQARLLLIALLAVTLLAVAGYATVYQRGRAAVAEFCARQEPGTPVREVLQRATRRGLSVQAEGDRLSVYNVTALGRHECTVALEQDHVRARPATGVQ